MVMCGIDLGSGQLVSDGDTSLRAQRSNLPEGPYLKRLLRAEFMLNVVKCPRNDGSLTFLPPPVFTRYAVIFTRYAVVFTRYAAIFTRYAAIFTRYAAVFTRCAPERYHGA